MVTSFADFWAAVSAFASDSDARMQNTLLICAAGVLVLLVVGLWVRAARAAALGGAVGLAVGCGLAAVLAVGFGQLSG